MKYLKNRNYLYALETYVCCVQMAQSLPLHAAQRATAQHSLHLFNAIVWG